MWTILRPSEFSAREIESSTQFALPPMLSAVLRGQRTRVVYLNRRGPPGTGRHKTGHENSDLARTSPSPRLENFRTSIFASARCRVRFPRSRQSNHLSGHIAYFERSVPDAPFVQLSRATFYF